MNKKRIGDTSTKYLVASLGARQKNAAQLKASVLSFSIEELIINAINHYKIELGNEAGKCHSCDTDLTITTKPYDYDTNINNVDYTIKILNYPRLKCNKCNTQVFSGDTGIHLERLMYYEIVQVLRDKRKVPGSVDFNELLKL